MKNLIILIIFCVAGYFAYQHFGIPWLDDKNSPRPTFNIYSLPERCQRAAESMESAFYRHKKGELVTAEVNGYKSNFRGCLKREGYTKSQIEEAYKGIAASADYNR